MDKIYLSKELRNGKQRNILHPSLVLITHHGDAQSLQLIIGMIFNIFRHGTRTYILFGFHFYRYHAMLRLYHKINLRRCFVATPIIGRKALGHQLLQDKLFGKSALKLLEYTISYQHLAGRRLGHTT